MIGRVIYTYRIEELIGEGGMGTVYRAVDNVLSRDIALKMLHSNLISQSSFFERFKNEAKILAKLNHVNIATLYNFIEDEGDFFMVMEFVEGEDLERFLRKNKRMELEKCLTTIMQALDGLGHAHKKGILHRDIKPANIIVNNDGEVKVMDFGIAKVVGSQKLTKVNKLIGTLEYIAPEILKGGEPSISSDLYAIGIVIYELLSGEMPFEASTDFDLMHNIVNRKPRSLIQFDPNFPKKLNDVFLKLMNKNPKNRYQSSLELKNDLSEILKTLNKKNNTVPAAPWIDKLKIEHLPKINTKWLRNLKVNKLPKVSPTWATKLKLDKVPNFNKTWIIVLVSVLIATTILITGKILNKTNDLGFENQEHPESDITEINDSINDETPTGFGLTIPEKVLQNETIKKDENNKEKEPNKNPKNEKKTTPKTPEIKDKKVIKEEPDNTEEKQTIPKVIEQNPKSVEPEKSDNTTTIQLNKTRIVVLLKERLDSHNASEGQPIRFEIGESLVMNGKVVFKKGATVRGHISDLKGAKALRNETMEFQITEAQASNGEWVKLRGSTFRQVEKKPGKSVVFNAGQQFYVDTVYKTLEIN